MDMNGKLIGYARCSTDKQDLQAQIAALHKLGVGSDRVYTDHGYSGTNRNRPGLDQALAAVREHDTFVVPKLDRLARSVPDARAICDDLSRRGVKLQIGSSIHDPADPMGRLFFNILATFAEFESDLIRMRTREGLAVARAKGKLKGRAPKLSPKREKDLRRLHDSGEYSINDLMDIFGIGRATVYRCLSRNLPISSDLQ
ncbi:recombinase family protein [Rhizobium pusense]|nr:recombinase family protein [Agrobacterium pusense]MDH2091966.1 recombinase family protein [Agrobacterium pusense]